MARGAASLRGRARSGARTSLAAPREMAGGAITEMLRVTATHEANAWLLSNAVGAIAAFVPLFLVGGGVVGGARDRKGARALPEGRRLTLLLALVLAGAIVGAAIGATLLPIVLRMPAAIARGSIAALAGGDRMAIGALAGFAIAGALVARALRLDPWGALDRLAPPLGVLVVAGRVGCFLEGCDFGRVASVAWAVTYPAGSHAFDEHVARGLVSATDVAALPVHPAQLYEAIVGIAMIAGAIAILRARPARAGLAFRAALGTYAVGRLVVEPFRGDARAMLGPLSLPQWLAIAILAWCVAGLFSDGDARAHGHR